MPSLSEGGGAVRLTGEQALALHDLIEGPLMNADVELRPSAFKSVIVTAHQDQWLICGDGRVAFADEDAWRHWEREAA